MKKILITIFIIGNVLNLNGQATGKWDLVGNAGTNASSNFIGTTDAVGLAFRTNGYNRMKISPGGWVGIGATSATPSSLFEVKSTSLGVLIPRMTKYDRDKNIVSPATGLLIYQTDSSKGVYHYNGSEWTSDWMVGGNTWSTPTPNYKLLGTTTPHSIYLIADNQPIMTFVPASLNSGYSKIEYRDGGLNGTTEKIWSYSFPASSAIQPDRVQMFETDSIGQVKGFLFSAPGTNSASSFSAINSSIGAISRNAIFAYSVPQSGYGKGILGVGGNIGVYGKGMGGNHNLSTVYGVNGYAVGMPGIGTRVGVYGKGDSARVTIGIYGSAGFGTDTTRAGYFSGDLQYTGFLIGPSDEKLKENIKTYSGALEKINKLSVKTYNFKPEYNFMHLPKDPQIGLISQDLEKIFPEMVIGSVHPADYNPETMEKISDEIQYKGVNYVGLIPVLIEGMNEQQLQIEELNKLKDEFSQLRNENADLKNQIAQINHALNLAPSKNSTLLQNRKPMLEQNTPNPFSNTTVIRYFIPEGLDHSFINIYSQEKVLLQSYPVTSSGNGEITIQSGLFSAGSYLYELVIEHKIIDSRKMMLTK